MEPGTHHIEVRYFENYGHAGLKLEWDGPGSDERALVGTPDKDSMQTVSGIPLSVNIDIDQTSLSSEDSVTLAGLPLGTVVSAGETMVTIDETGTADITGWDTNAMSITPPPDFVGDVEAEIAITAHSPLGHPATAIHPLSFDVNAANLSGPQVEMVGGFKASYFDVDHSLRKIDDIDWDSAPTHQEFVQDIDYANSRESFWEGGSRDTFGAKLEGKITVEEGGGYTFFAGGDDGITVFINGEPVVDNDGLHSFRTRSGEVDLEPGTHEIEVRYFENYGYAGLKLEWEGPDTDGRELVTSDLQNHVAENGTFEVGLDLKNGGTAAQVSMEGLPADTILIVGDQSIMSDGGPVDLTGLDVRSLEIFPPPGFEGAITGNIVVTDEAFNGAEVRTTSPYSLSVGKATIPSESQTQNEDLLMAHEENGKGWDEDPDQSNEDASEVDVLTESVPQTSGDEFAAVNTDTYERIDW